MSEKFLFATAGWETMKGARELLKAGRVSAAVYEPPLLTGEVRAGAKRYRAGLRIRGATEVENLCTCREAREWGKICPHSVAVGLAVLAPPVTAVAPPVLSQASAEKTDRRFVSLGEKSAGLATLHFILPQNFSAAWTRAQVMVVIEAELEDHRRLPLDALPQGERFALDDFDLAALESLGGEARSLHQLSGPEFLRWLSALRGHPRLTFGKTNRAEVMIKKLRPVIALRAVREGYELFAKLESRDVPLHAGQTVWLLCGNEFWEVGENLPVRLAKVMTAPLRLVAEGFDEFYAIELPAWREFVELELPPGILIPAIEPGQRVFALQLEGSLQHLRARLRCHYGAGPGFVPLAEPEKRLAMRIDDRLFTRNLAAEADAIAQIEQAGFVRAGDHFELRDPDRIVRFFAFGQAKLPDDWEVKVEPRLEKAHAEIEPARPRVEIVASGEDWFEFQYSVTSPSGEGISLAEVQRLLRSGSSRARLRNGKTAALDPEALDDFEQLLRDVDPRQSRAGVYRLKKIHAGYVTNTAAEMGARLVDPAEKLRHSQPAELSALPASLHAQLREYQRTGVRWLSALAAQNLGGILADEMGLGKTVQMLALLLLGRGQGPALIVSPRSLLPNWEREAGRFTPELKLQLIDGSERERSRRIARMPEYDLNLTSYGLLRRDLEHYAAQQFSAVVLDEAQHIKNPETQNAQAAFRLQARSRFVLTGTPMENSVRDLWSLLNFVAPGYLGSRSDFRERYEKPLTSRPDPAIQRRLARRLQPFLLRRTKSEVAPELPEKIEQVVPCVLGPRQRAAYDALLREIQNGITSSGKNANTQRMQMLTGLLRLRQACCDLRLLGFSPNDDEETSAKLDLFDELLGEIIDGGHRVLVFSQFVQMLDLVRQRVQSNQVPHCYLSGATRDRQQEVDRFQENDSIPVFLISLKAGGVGLNLSGADTVIHFDPWWNAAVEAQATDRAHRIGQRRVVTSYKLIARQTVEEKILNLQARKQALAGAMLAGAGAGGAGLTTEELEELLA